MENALSAQLTETELKSEYDQCAKRLIAQKVILAWILKSCAHEFQEFSVEYIMEHCIEAEPQITLLSATLTLSRLSARSLLLLRRGVH